jgi:DNA-binding response OmpR family regulator
MGAMADVPTPAPRPTVLVVDDDPAVGRMVRLSIEIDGAAVLSAESLADARLLLSPDLHGIVLDRRLPDGDGLDLLPEIERACPEVPVVVYSGLDDGREPSTVTRVAKTDMVSLFDALGLGQP